MKYKGIEVWSVKYPVLTELEKGFLQWQDWVEKQRLAGLESYSYLFSNSTWRGDPRCDGKIRVVKEIREITKTGLLEAKRLVDYWDERWDGKSELPLTGITLEFLMEGFGYPIPGMRKWRAGRMLRPVPEGEGE